MSKASGDPNKSKSASSAEGIECMGWIASCSAWSVARNDRERLDPTVVKKPLAALKTTGNFHVDYVRYCKVMNLAPHPCLKGSPEAYQSEDVENEEDESAAILSVQHVILDTGSCTALFMALKASAITEITFFNTALSPQDIIELSRSLPKTCVEKLRIEYNPIIDNNADALNCFADIIRVKGILTELSLRGNKISEIHIPNIAAALAQTRLSVLNLFDNRIGDVGASAIAEALRFNMCIKSISLSKNGIGDNGALALSNLFTPCIETPEHTAARKLATSAVDEQNKIITDINKRNAKSKTKKMQLDKIEHPKKPVEVDNVEWCVGNTSLSYLNLSVNDIEDAAFHLAKAISDFKSNRGLSGCKMKGLAINMNRCNNGTAKEVQDVLGGDDFVVYV